MGEEELYPHTGVLLLSDPVPQYICIKFPKADDNDRAHKNDDADRWLMFFSIQVPHRRVILCQVIQAWT